ncbi:transcriptional regulator [Geomonas silvestris]|uniref:Transcriptional regulator n=1 Tax=Geomonas silvestris TaxID=2740184 RepID=A0A6V8MGS4_9BACT|nr:metalloregulator ArsR/SmtB family transcription factor [Geomonas silvestris]GFO59191.1 transcriptional regulator [Geomonas silvestris]
MFDDSAKLFKALSDETRLRILALLIANGELCVCDLTATLQLPQSTVSRHLAYLRKSGLVRDRREGLWMYYSLERKRGFPETLVGFLTENLLQLPEARADQQRLQSTSEANRCA